MICIGCNSDVRPSVAMTDRGTQRVCPQCSQVFAAVDVDERQVAVKAEPVVRKTEPARVVVQSDSRDLVESVRARIASIDVELERLATLRTERKRLGAMLRAAEKTR
jgi:uncharacterized Zn finger protein (UPF0148 family)